MIMADIAIINKVDTAKADQIESVRTNIERHAPEASILLAESTVLVDDPERIGGKRVLVVEDGPTLTHGGMSFGAGTIAAKTHGAAEIVDPRGFAVGTIKHAFERYPHIGPVLPAVGYSREQIHDLQQTIDACDCDRVLFATPVDLPRILSIKKPTIRVRYEYRDHNPPGLADVLMRKLEKTISSQAF
jgi:predicted GTPase